jgi:hypothetical protein
MSPGLPVMKKSSVRDLMLAVCGGPGKWITFASGLGILLSLLHYRKKKCVVDDCETNNKLMMPLMARDGIAGYG